MLTKPDRNHLRGKGRCLHLNRSFAQVNPNQRRAAGSAEALRWSQRLGVFCVFCILVVNPAAAWSLGYGIAPGAIFESLGASPPEPLPLTGHFELTPAGVCPVGCEPDAYHMIDVVLDAGESSLSNGIVDVVFAGPVFDSPAFEILANGAIATGGFPIERTVTSTGTLTDHPQNYAFFQTFTERAFGPMAFLGPDPRQVLFTSPRGTWPIEVTLAYAVIERTGTAFSGYDGSGGLFAHRLVLQPDVVLGYVVFSATAIPEPGTISLLFAGTLGLAWMRRHRAH